MRKAIAIAREYRRLRALLDGVAYRPLEAFGLAIYNVEFRGTPAAIVKNDATG